MNFIGKCFFAQKMGVCRNKMLHQILSDHHFGTLSKTKKRDDVHHIIS